MKRPLVYPFFFVLLIILTPLANNIDQLDPLQVIRPLSLLILAVTITALFFRLLFKDWHYAFYLIFLITLYLFGFGYLNRFIRDLLARFYRVIDERVLLAICAGVLLIFALKWTWSRLGGRTWLVSYLNWLMLLWLIFPAYGLFSRYLVKPVHAEEVTIETQDEIGRLMLDCTSSPDIYYIILDAYGRADSLKDLYGFNNQPFLDYLSGKGFYVAGESYTNYIQTIFSIPSSLNFNYIKPPGEGVVGQYYFSGLMRENQIMTALKRCGYRSVAIESGFYFTDHPDVDIYLKRGIGPTEFESLLLADSPVDVLANELGLQPSKLSYEAHRRRVLYSFEMLRRLPRMSGPKFVFAHIISPHPPFIFNQHGQPLVPKHNYYIGDGDDFQGDLDEYLAGYPEQVLYVNHQLQLVIDRILADSKVPPVIIIQGDHGPGSRLVWDSPSDTCLWERTPIINAYYLPGDGNRFLYPSISPVNSFRVVLNTYFQAGLPLLPDDTYFTSHLLEREAIDITAIRTSQENCSPQK